MNKQKIKTGEVFKAFNKFMTPPKIKYHVCINSKIYLMINSKESLYSCPLTPKDCSILTKECYIDCTRIKNDQPLKDFEIIQIAELSARALKELFERIKISPVLSQIQKDVILSELAKVIKL